MIIRMQEFHLRVCSVADSVCWPDVVVRLAVTVRCSIAVYVESHAIPT